MAKNSGGGSRGARNAGVGGTLFYGAGGGAWVAGVEALWRPASYDVGVEWVVRGVRGGFCGVQVKSTVYKRRGEGYSLNVMGPQRDAVIRVGWWTFLRFI